MKKCENLNIESITSAINLLKNDGSLRLPEKKSGLKKAAVIVPFVCVDGEWSLLFTRRSDNLTKHSGQVSFPGGAMESQDKSLVNTALRETQEEIGIPPEEIKIIGMMPEFLTVSDFIISPIVAQLNWPLKLTISESEVKRVFTIPLKWLQNPENWEERIFSHPNGWYGNVYFYKPYDGEILWGISAKITIDLVQKIN
jgi:8-oxo-dGTP pyrophosphatase MutT (NUDIX family)